MNWNAEGIVTGDAEKVEELSAYAEKFKPAIMVITESHLCAKVKNGILTIPGYNIYRVDRDQQKAGTQSGGGVLIYCQEELELEDETEVREEDTEIFAANIPQLHLRFIATYRRPGRSIRNPHSCG